MLITFIEACDKITFEYLQTHRHRSPGTNNARNNVSTSGHESPVDVDDDSAAPSDVDNESGDEDTLKITLRSAITKPLTLTVRQTTKCSAIVQAFLKQNNLTDKYPSVATKGKKKGRSQPSGPALVVDGDRLEPDDEISVADLEDGDMVEVVGL